MICEPPTARSPHCWHQFTKAVYANTSNLTYTILTLLFGWPLSFICGLSYGVKTFFFVWLVTPVARAWFILLGLAGKLWMSIMKSFCDPYFESCGRCFSNLNITFRSATIQDVWLGHFLLLVISCDAVKFYHSWFCFVTAIFLFSSICTAPVSLKLALLDFLGSMLSSFAHKLRRRQQYLGA